MKNAAGIQTNELIETGKIKKARTFFEKFWGLMFQKESGIGLFFENTKYMHTFFMRFDLDFFFLDKDGGIIGVKRNVKPFRIVLPLPKTVSVAEMPSKLKFKIENLGIDALRTLK